MKNLYKELKAKQQEDYNNFPIMFAFSDKQFKKGMENFGLTENDTDKIYSIGCGGFIRKSDSKAFDEMNRKHKQELEKAMKDYDFVYSMFYYELCNHEYYYSRDLTDTINGCGLSEEDITNNEMYLRALQAAKKDYIKKCNKMEY